MDALQALDFHEVATDANLQKLRDVSTRLNPLRKFLSDIQIGVDGLAEIVGVKHTLETQIADLMQNKILLTKQVQTLNQTKEEAVKELNEAVKQSQETLDVQRSEAHSELNALANALETARLETQEKMQALKAELHLFLDQAQAQKHAAQEAVAKAQELAKAVSEKLMGVL